MAEWHIPFDYIEDHWTVEQFMMFWRRLVERKEAEQHAMKRESEHAY